MQEQFSVETLPANRLAFQNFVKGSGMYKKQRSSTASWTKFSQNE